MTTREPDRRAILDGAISRAEATGWTLSMRTETRAELSASGSSERLFLEVERDGTVSQQQVVSTAAMPEGNAGRDGSIMDFLVFRRMITPLLIQFVFWIGAGLAALVGVVAFLAGLVNSSLTGVFGGLALLFFGPLLIRIWCELLILFFRMNETLTDIKNRLPRDGIR